MNLHRPALGLLLTLLLAACASTAKHVTGSPGGSEADLLTAQATDLVQAQTIASERATIERYFA